MYLDWLKSLFILVPLWIIGIIFVKRIITERRAEIVLPLGFILGITTYIFLLNITAFIFKGISGIIISFVTLLIFAIFIRGKISIEGLDFPRGKSRFLWIISVVFWWFFLLIPVSHNRFGGEDFMYYSIGHTFAKGNFPILSPWQPDLYVAYHYGGAIFLGAVNALTGVHFDILHRLIPLLLVFSIFQLLIWGLKRHTSYFTFLIYQVIPIIGMISYGIFGSGSI